VAIGAPTAGRSAEAAGDLVGFFVNMLVLRTDLSGEPSLRTLLRRVRETDLEAFAHQDAPFDQVVDELNPPRPPLGAPWLDVVLALQNNARAELDLPGVEARMEILRTGAARFDLLVDVTEDRQGLELVLEYRSGMFDEPVARWLVDALTHTLATMVAAPDTPVAELPAIPYPVDCSTPGLADGSRRFSPPDSEAERRVAAVWAEVLDAPRIGRHDNFFELGGNSLRAVRVAARLSVSAAQVFAAPTVAELARELTTDVPVIARLPRIPRSRED
jgi:nonribosomal peptide synthetase DhbF